MSRTVIVAFASVVIGVLTMLGITVPDGFQDTIVNNLDTVIGGVIALYGVVMWVLRAVTDSPLASWWGGK